MSRYSKYDRHHDQKAHHRSFLVGIPMTALAIFLGVVAYRTYGTFPFTMGTTLFVGGLSLASGIFGLCVLFGVIILDSRSSSTYY